MENIYVKQLLYLKGIYEINIYIGISKKRKIKKT